MCVRIQSPLALIISLFSEHNTLNNISAHYEINGEIVEFGQVRNASRVQAHYATLMHKGYIFYIFILPSLTNLEGLQKPVVCYFFPQSRFIIALTRSLWVNC
jgi:hypothetical protein